MEPNQALKDIRHSLHELAQPLAAVTGLVDLLLLEPPVDGSVYEEIEVISNKLEQVLEIISHIRDIARAGTQPYDEELLLLDSDIA